MLKSSRGEPLPRPKMKAAVLVSVLFIAFSAASQTPERCTSPVLWEASTFEGSPPGERILGKMFYDAINERYVSQVVYYDYDDVRQNSTEYYFYKLGYGFAYTPWGDQCSRFNLTTTFPKIGVSPTAKFVGTYMIGTQREGAAIHLWADSSQSGIYIVDGFIMDNKHCLPVVHTEYGTPHQISYYNISLNVDPASFVPPAVCTKGDL